MPDPEHIAGLLYERGAELEGQQIAVMNGICHPSLQLLKAVPGRLMVQQQRRDDCLALQRAGYAISREIRQGPFDIVLVLAGRQREQTMGWLARGLRLLDGSGWLALCAANAMGAKGYEKRLAELGADISVSSKSKCRVVLLRADRISRPEVLDTWIEAAAPRVLADGGLLSCPGVFSWAHPDRGSRLLLDHLPPGLAGCGMDLGCGNGYLSCHVLGRYVGITAWHAVDVDAVALDCAARNLQDLQTTCSVHTHWLDATRERMPGGMDVVLMNPPFHKDKADIIALGQAMIKAARSSLKSSGSLFLVANRHLPYELLLYQSFEQVSALFEGEGYKVMRCDGVSD